jgi:hypothetical protein
MLENYGSIINCIGIDKVITISNKFCYCDSLNPTQEDLATFIKELSMKNIASLVKIDISKGLLPGLRYREISGKKRVGFLSNPHPNNLYSE